MDRDESQRGREAAIEPAADWESAALARVRSGLERADAHGRDAGWEEVALERLRAHFDAEG